MKRIKRLLSLTLAILMLMTSLPAMGITVSAANDSTVQLQTSADTTTDSGTAPDTETDTIATGCYTPPVLMSASGELVTTGTVTRAAWLHNLALIFNMTVETDSIPDNYFSDLPTTHTYYDDILLAVNFGVVDIEAGSPLNPDGALTRDFAASTLNFCLGYQLAEDATYTFADSADCADPDSAQIALDRGWFALQSGNFSPAATVTQAEVQAMVADAQAVVADAVVDTDYESTYEFAEGVIVVEQGTLVSMDEEGVLSITDCPATIAAGDKFAVYYGDIPNVYAAESVSTSGNITTIATSVVEDDDAFVSIDAQGATDAGVLEIIPEEGFEVEMTTESPVTTFGRGTKKISTIHIPETTIEITKGIYASLEVYLYNPVITYTTNSNQVYVCLDADSEIIYNISGNWTTASGFSKALKLFTCNVLGIGEFSIEIVMDVSGSVTGTVRGNLVAGLDWRSGQGIRAVKNFHQSYAQTQVEATGKLGLKAKLGVVDMPGITANIFAEMGLQSKAQSTTYKDGNQPEKCTHFTTHIYAKYGATASLKVGIFTEKFDKTFDVYTLSNSPLRIIHHYENGIPKASCTRGTYSMRYTTNRLSRHSGTGWSGANGLYGLDTNGEPFVLYDYELDDSGNAVITAYNGNASAVYIPEKLDDYTVTGIGYRAFSQEEMQHVTIPNTVTTIDNYAFEDCLNLRSVTVGDSVTDLGNGAFEDCVSLSSVSLPDSLERLQSYVFNRCISLQSITLPKRLKAMQSFAFGYTGLRQITIPKSLEDAYNSGTHAYDYNGESHQLYTGPFVGCESLTKVTFEQGTTTIADSLFAGCVGLTEVVIPDTVTAIGSNAFATCLRLQDVTIGEAVTEIHNLAFYYCLSLDSVVIPDSVIAIEIEAFRDATSLKNVTLSKSLQSLGGGAFQNTAIEAIEIPKSLETCPSNFGGEVYNGESISYPVGPFAGCQHLQTVTFETGTDKVVDDLFGGCTYLTSVTLPDTITRINDRAFNGCLRLKTITMSKQVTEIEWYAFTNCRALESITLPDTLTTVGYQVFENCTSLKTVTVPDSVTDLRMGGFKGCTSLESVTLPKNCKNALEESMFQNCTSLKEITIPAKVEFIDNYAFSGCTSLKKVTFAEGSKLREIRGHAFENCESLTDIVLPTSLEGIYSNAFEACSALEKIHIPYSVKKWMNEIFLNCGSLTEVTFDDYSLTELGENTFMGCALTKIELPIGLERIGANTFKNITTLTEITIPQTVTEIDSSALSYPNKTTICGVKGSYAEEFAEAEGFKFKDITAPCQGMAPVEGQEEITLIEGESYRVQLEILPENTTDIITLSNDGDMYVEFDGLTLIPYYDEYAPTTVVTATSTSGASCEIVVNVLGIQELQITRQPQKTTFGLGEALDLTGMELQLLLSDGSTRDVTEYEVEYYDPTYEGEQQIVIRHTASNGWDYETELTVTVADLTPKATGIKLSSLPTKRAYLKRELLDTTGMVVQATYSDGSTVDVTADCTVTGYNALKIGTQTVTVAYDGHTVTFTVTVYDGEIPAYTPGDVDSNGSVNANDALQALQIATGKITPDVISRQAADVDGNESVSANDALMILQYATKKINSF